MSKKVNFIWNKVVAMMVMVFCFSFLSAFQVSAEESSDEVQMPDASGNLQLDGFTLEVTASEGESSDAVYNVLPVFSGDMGNDRYLLRVTADNETGQSVSPTKRFDASGSVPASCELNTSKLSQGQTFVVSLYKEDFDSQYLVVNSFSGIMPSAEPETAGDDTENNDAEFPSEAEESPETEKIPETEKDTEIEFEDDTPSCLHEFEYLPCKDATVTSDALLAYTCIKCGEETRYTEIPNSAYAAFLMESIKAVKNGGATAEDVIDANVVTIKTDRWISFNYAVLSAISERPDVNVVVEFMYHGELHSFTIPAGTDVLSLADENGYAGFLFLEQEMNLISR